MPGLSRSRGGCEPGAGDRLLLSERIRDALADEIASGALEAGASLDEQQIANRYGASRTPVREALRQLAAGGLVDLRARRGGVVTKLTPARVMDLFETTAEIEAMCVRLATYRVTPIERSHLHDLHYASAEFVAARDVGSYDRLNREFHEIIYRATHNDFMAEQALAIRARLDAFRRGQLRYGDRIVASREEHGLILAAMAEGDGDLAGRRMRAHMLNAAGALKRYIAERVSTVESDVVSLEEERPNATARSGTRPGREPWNTPTGVPG